MSALVPPLCDRAQKAGVPQRRTDSRQRALSLSLPPIQKVQGVEKTAARHRRETWLTKGFACPIGKNAARAPKLQQAADNGRESDFGEGNGASGEISLSNFQ
ncbi:hypothetical protein [Stappia sp. 28M-7]|uniref:hypothetical protein n=1 Tax=Stappia sp. 28M-7 TaxID=2762596 RepID=UPI00163C5F6B|nr:hypothetical protein [Stappia sp. 28M-7]MBC2858489.1 hypothetical protein [Stappia sp. 28M-7]